MSRNNTHLGHTARKRFGQNFLTDSFVIQQIIRAIKPTSGDTLLEIGPGLGALTYPMLEVAEQLTVIELDRDLAQRLIDNQEIKDKITVIQGDALKIDISPIAKERAPFKVFGNLPYNISTPLLFRLFEFSSLIDSMHFMLQKEVVDRMAAQPGNKQYGRLSVMTQYYCKVIPVLEVPPNSFVPPPAVDSAVVRLLPKNDVDAHSKLTQSLDKVCKAAFSQRRKTLRNTLKGTLPLQALEFVGIDPGLRAETLTLQQFISLAQWDCDNQSSSVEVGE